MGPRSKDAVIRALGHLTDELLSQRHILQNIQSSIEKGADEWKEDLRELGKRVTEHEKRLNQLPR